MPLDHAVAVVLDGSLLVIGGMLNGRPSSTLWRLDPGSGSATRAGTLPEAVSIPAAAVLGGSAYVMGGEARKTLDTMVRITRKTDARFKSRGLCCQVSDGMAVPWGPSGPAGLVDAVK